MNKDMIGLALVAILLSLVLFGILCFVELPDHVVTSDTGVMRSLPDQPCRAPLGWAFDESGRLMYVGSGFDNIMGGMVIVSTDHPTNEQEFNELQNAGVKTTEPEGGN